MENLGCFNNNCVTEDLKPYLQWFKPPFLEIKFYLLLSEWNLCFLEIIHIKEGKYHFFLREKAVKQQV